MSRHTSRHYIQWQTFSNPLMTKTMSKRSQKTPRPKLVNVWWHTHLIHTLFSTLNSLPDQDGIHSILLHSFLRPIALAGIKPAWEDSISSKGKVHCLQTYPCFECMLVWILEWIGLFTTPRSMKPVNPAVVSKATDITTPSRPRIRLIVYSDYWYKRYCTSSTGPAPSRVCSTPEPWWFCCCCCPCLVWVRWCSRKLVFSVLPEPLSPEITVNKKIQINFHDKVLLCSST